MWCRTGAGRGVREFRPKTVVAEQEYEDNQQMDGYMV